MTDVYLSKNRQTEVDSGTSRFTVDSALLHELGERLVGRPHIALAELVKNSYDADAFHVDILFEENSIHIIDNGHGMSREEFERFWMRVGSPHKQEQRFSEELGRPLTGSKGIGRLAVQFLAREIEIRTCRKGSHRELRAEIDWDEAVTAGELTEAQAAWTLHEPVTTKFSRSSTNGTWIKLTRLNNPDWTEDAFEGLAREIWWLQPPFLDPYRDTSLEFTVELTTPYPEVLKTFEQQMRAFMELWYAKIEGELVRADERMRDSTDAVGKTTQESAQDTRKVRIVLQFSDGDRHTHEWTVDGCAIDRLHFEVRTYYLTGRQKYGIKVARAREYFEDHGGVYVYDSGFRLPYYGGKEHDWLGLEFAHAHRLSRSKLLPEELQVVEGLTYLPTNSRILGDVRIDTAHERSLAKRQAATSSHLEIQVTRDRLVDNRAYQQLCEIVRTAIDYYAVMEARRVYKKRLELEPIESSTRKLERIEEVLARHENDIPSEVFTRLDREVREAVAASESEAEARAGQVALLAPLATAGMAALAYEHEVGKQLALLEDMVSRIDSLARAGPAERAAGLASLRDDLMEWIGRARQTRRLFTHLLDEDNRQLESRLRAKSLLREIVEQSCVLLRGASIDIESLDEELRLPRATFAEWSALFQNVLVNAMNAMIDSQIRKVRLSSRERGRAREILVEDTGIGIDLGAADTLFKPFERALKISRERRMLGMGGTGLGLTIVRMIAENRGCRVDFVAPATGFATAFRLHWKEDSR